MAGTADAILIASPEYAHEMPGSLKNALDWLVGGREMPGMPVALLSASARATYAQASLAETLRTMSANVVPGSPFVAPVTGRGLDATGAADDPKVRAAVAAAISALARAVAERLLGER
jgi:NAD(P)H-dependent FMN reductase